MSLTSSNKIEKNKVELEVSVDETQFQDAILKAYRTNVKKIAIPGFRKGKAPKAMIEKMYGADFFYEDAINAIYPVAYEQAVEEAGVEPVDRADVTDLKIDPETKGFSFKATVTVKPEVSVKDYKGIKVDKKIDSIMAADVNAELDKMRERNGRLVTVETRAAKLQDMANIDFEGFKEGVAFEGGKGEGVQLNLGSHQFIEGFEEQVVGKKIGEEFEVSVTFPEEYHSPDLAGQPAVFKVKLNSLQEKEMPVLDDEFAKDVSEFDTLADLKKDLKEKLQVAADKRAQNEAENNLITIVIENMETEIPNCMIENKINEMMNDFSYRLQSQGMNLEMYLQYAGLNMVAFHDTFKDSAERQVKIRLALEKIAEVENITVSDEEVAAEYEKMAKHYNIEIEKVKTFLKENEIKKDVAVNKAIDLIRDSAELTEKKVKKVSVKAKKNKDNAETEEVAEETEE